VKQTFFERARARLDRRGGRWRVGLLGMVLIATAAACTIPAPPPYPYWGPYGSAAGVTQEAQSRSARLEQYVKDFLDGKVPAAIPDSLIPEGHDAGVSHYYVQTEAQVDPSTQWANRKAHDIDWNAAMGSFPDPHASYLVLVPFLAPFGSKMIMTGQFPHARYFSVQPTPSFQAQNYRYQGIGEGEVSYVDADINPDPGSVNPYRVGADRNATNRSFTLTCDFTVGDPMVLDTKAWTAPNYRDPGNNNRHCSGLTFRGPWGDPAFKDANGNNSGDKRGLWDTGQMWVRYYAPDRGTGAFGGVPYPKVLYQLPDGRKYFINADVSGIQTRVDGKRALTAEAGQQPSATWGTGFGWWKQLSIFRQIAGGMSHENSYPSKDLAAQQAYARNLDLGVEGKGEAVGGIMAQEPHATSGVHINYLNHGTCLPNGSTFTVQGRLPTTPRTRNGEATMTGAQARYWSITGYSSKWSTNNDPSFVYGAEITSLMDDEIVTDAQGGYVLMYGRPEDRPANATAANGITWVNWGPEACQAFTIRWMSVGPEWSFAKAPNFTNLGWPADFAATVSDPTKVATNFRRGFLVDYQPITATLTKAQVASLGRINPLDSDLALRQPAFASTSCCGGTPGAATDGDPNTSWQSNWSSSTEWLGVDLGSARTVDWLRLTWYGGAYGKAYKVQVSNDKAAWTTVLSRTGGTGGTEVLPLPTPASGRYVRVLVSQPAGAASMLTNVEVWGR